MGKTSKLRYGAAVAAAAVVVVLGSSCAAIGGEPEPEVVTIGVDLELSGANVERGQVFLQAIELRVEQLNEQGLLGDRRLEIESLDNRSDRPTSVANLRALAADPSISAIITGQCGECVLEAADAIDQHGVPTVSLSGIDAVVEPVAERPHIFKLGPNAADNAAILATTMDREGIDTIALVTTQDEYGQDGQSAMTDAAERAGLEVVVTETITANADRLEGAAAEVASYEAEPEQTGGFIPDQTDEPAETGPDAVVVWAPSPMVGDFAVHLRAAGYDGPLYLDAAAADDVILVGAGGNALSGATMVFTETLVIDDVIATSPAKAARKTWVRDYTARFGRYHASSSFAADAVELIYQAMASFEGADSDRGILRSAMEVAQLEGFTGTIQMSPRQHSGLRPQTLVTLVASGDRWRPSA